MLTSNFKRAALFTRPDVGQERGGILIHEVIRLKENAFRVCGVNRKRGNACVNGVRGIGETGVIQIARVEAVTIFHGSFSFRCPVVPGKYKITYFGIIVKGFLQN